MASAAYSGLPGTAHAAQKHEVTKFVTGTVREGVEDVPNSLVLLLHAVHGDRAIRLVTARIGTDP
jgi:hypothetical protein